MTTVFLSGSRKINRLNDVSRSRIENIADQGFSVVVGDANGADKAMQAFLAERHYSNISPRTAQETLVETMSTSGKPRKSVLT